MMMITIMVTSVMMMMMPIPGIEGEGADDGHQCDDDDDAYTWYIRGKGG